MTVKLLTPRLGEGVEEVTVIQWLKKEGDPVKELESIVEVETDKVATEIPSPADGILLKIFIPPDSVAHVGDPLAEIGEPGESTGTPQPAAEPLTSTAPTPQPSAQTAPIPENASQPGEPWISPLVRKMAAENHLDVSRLHGTGLGGRVTKQDVQDALSSRVAPPAAQPAPAIIPGAPAAHDLQQATAVEAISGEVLPLSSVRRQIAERMLQSIHTSPHVLTVMEADLTCILAHQAQHKESFAAEGIRLTLTAYFISAIASALRAHPLVNASWTDAGILLHRQINIGMAVSLGDAGLIVPVIKNADSLSLIGLARAINDLAERARAKKLLPDEVKGGTFTLTNHGTGGSLFAFPIINQPQVGILGTGTLQKRAVVVTDANNGSDAIAIRPMLYLSFVFDHRILDGASADSFLSDVKKSLEGDW